MMDIMKSEFYKVRKSVVTFVVAFCFLGIAAIVSASCLYGRLAGGIWGEMMEGTEAVDIYASFPNGSFFLIFIALFVGGMISNEYTNRTVRQVVSRGTSRVQIALGQYIALSTAMTIIIIVSAAICSVVAGLCYSFGSISVGRFLVLLIGQIVVIWSYAAITMLIAHLTRSGGLSIGINIMLLMGGSVAAQLLAILTKKEFFMTYWLENMQLMALEHDGPVAGQWKFIGILFALGIIFVVLGTVRFKIKDVD